MSSVIVRRDYFVKFEENPLPNDLEIAVDAIRRLRTAVSSREPLLLFGVINTKQRCASIADIEVRKSDGRFWARTVGPNDYIACMHLLEFTLRPKNILIVNGRGFEVVGDLDASVLASYRDRMSLTDREEAYRRFTQAPHHTAEDSLGRPQMDPRQLRKEGWKAGLR